ARLVRQVDARPVAHGRRNMDERQRPVAAEAVVNLPAGDERDHGQAERNGHQQSERDPETGPLDHVIHRGRRYHGHPDALLAEPAPEPHTQASKGASCARLSWAASRTRSLSARNVTSSLASPSAPASTNLPARASCSASSADASLSSSFSRTPSDSS